ncbi:hypothetical protein [Paracoccus pacificus]|uniref:Uncharacterized protein n=1 Tax=Paracoccus pacificus TaxID=1463598 RepID=A0ABW4R6X0_9RHOB
MNDLPAFVLLENAKPLPAIGGHGLIAIEAVRDGDHLLCMGHGTDP